MASGARIQRCSSHSFSGAEHEADEPNDPVPTMASHTPMAQAEVEAQQIAAPTRTTSMEVMEMTMGTLTSPAARRALGMVKARGQNSMRSRCG